jgi:hypothetical protein
MVQLQERIACSAAAEPKGGLRESSASLREQRTSPPFVINRFDPKKMGEKYLALVLGRKRTGKSMLAADLTRKTAPPKKARVLFTSDSKETMPEFLRQEFEDLKTYNLYDKSDLDHIHWSAKELNKKSKKPVHIVFDDVLPSGNSLMNIDDAIFVKFCNEYRFSNVSCIITEYPLMNKFHSSFKDKFNYLFIGNIGEKEIEWVHRKLVVDIIPDLALFTRIVHDTTRGNGTSDRNFLVISFSLHTDDWKEKLSFYPVTFPKVTLKGDTTVN